MTKPLEATKIWSQEYNKQAISKHYNSYNELTIKLTATSQKQKDKKHTKPTTIKLK
jgi:hypothetical protein